MNKKELIKVIEAFNNTYKGTMHIWPGVDFACSNIITYIKSLDNI